MELVREWEDGSAVTFLEKQKQKGSSYSWRIFRDPMQWTVLFADRPRLLFPRFSLTYFLISLRTL
jgi:hypothetical protein